MVANGSAPKNAAASRSLAVVDEVLVPAGRYTSAAFAALEREGLWSRVWQIACRLEDVPEPGDFFEYRIANQSILIVRQPDGSVRAFHNACRHRGMPLGCGSGSYVGGQITCPFHGWRWELSGANSYVHHKWGFPESCMSDDALRLREVSVQAAHGLVWVNLDAAAPPLRDALGALDDTLTATGLGQMRVCWWRQLVLPANWKAAIEAFMEGYHVMQTHPEFVLGVTGDDVPQVTNYVVVPEGHGWYAVPVGARTKESGVPQKISPGTFMINMHRVMWDGARGQLTARQLAIQEELLASGVGEDEFAKAFFAACYEDAARNGTPLPPLSSNATSHAYLFPNATFVQELGNAIMFRARPAEDDPNSCVFDIWSLSTQAEAAAGRPTPDADIDDLWFLQQDLANLRRQQTGLRTAGHEASRISPRFEPMITNFHRRLDELVVAARDEED